MTFDSAQAIAAAILYEGYILYPYRPTAVKNRQRWNFGTLYPRIYAEAQRPEEPFQLVAECLAMADANACVEIKVSFLQLLRKQVSSAAEPALTDPSLAWEEAVERTSVQRDLRLKDLLGSSLVRTLAFGTADSVESAGGDALQATLTIGAEQRDDGSCTLRVEFANASALASGAVAKRDEALPRSFVSTHVLLGIKEGEFLSLLDPGERFRESAAACRNVGVFPVLVGEEPERRMMLCSPIILYDYPKIAAESEGDFFDGTEMDEMLTLRVLTLTDAEKQEMRLGDARARRILERTESLTEEAMRKAHGVVRGLREIREEGIAT
jgi:hydrogenase maturation protease